MEKIGIFGGTFDPVHLEHVEIAKTAVNELKLDKLIVMPNFISPHKTDFPVSSFDRISMLERAFSGCDKIEISDYEVKKEGTSYTYLTVEHFKERCDCDLYFICGGDMLTDFKRWKYPERILNCCTLAVFDRENSFTDFDGEREYFEKTFNKQFIKLSYIGKNLSSTKIRTYASFSLPLNGLVDGKVEEYIKEKGLYKQNPYAEYLRAVLPEKRLVHTANVVVSALKKAKENGLDKNKVIIACTLHDCAKYVDASSVEGFEVPNGMPKPVVHAYLGAYIAEKILKINDEEITNAIRYHTSGRPNMTALEKLVFVADMIEEGRSYEGVDFLRNEYENKSLDECFVSCLKEEYIHLKNRSGDIFHLTTDAFNYYVKQ